MLQIFLGWGSSTKIVANVFISGTMVQNLFTTHAFMVSVSPTFIHSNSRSRILKEEREWKEGKEQCCGLKDKDFKERLRMATIMVAHHYRCIDGGKSHSRKYKLTLENRAKEIEEDLEDSVRRERGIIVLDDYYHGWF